MEDLLKQPLMMDDDEDIDDDDGFDDDDGDDWDE